MKPILVGQVVFILMFKYASLLVFIRPYLPFSSVTLLMHFESIMQATSFELGALEPWDLKYTKGSMNNLLGYTLLFYITIYYFGWFQKILSCCSSLLSTHINVSLILWILDTPIKFYYLMLLLILTMTFNASIFTFSPKNLVDSVSNTKKSAYVPHHNWNLCIKHIFSRQLQRIKLLCHMDCICMPINVNIKYFILHI